MLCLAQFLLQTCLQGPRSLFAWKNIFFLPRPIVDFRPLPVWGSGTKNVNVQQAASLNDSFARQIYISVKKLIRGSSQIGFWRAARGVERPAGREERVVALAGRRAHARLPKSVARWGPAAIQKALSEADYISAGIESAAFAAKKLAPPAIGGTRRLPRRAGEKGRFGARGQRRHSQRDVAPFFWAQEGEAVVST